MGAGCVSVESSFIPGGLLPSPPSIPGGLLPSPSQMQNAPLYATSNAMQRRDAAVVLASHLPSMTWQDGENILDVGSGSGDVTSGLLYEAIPVDCSLVGCDVSKEMVSYATEHHSADNIKF